MDKALICGGLCVALVACTMDIQPGGGKTAHGDGNGPIAAPMADYPSQTDLEELVTYIRANRPAGSVTVQYQATSASVELGFVAGLVPALLTGLFTYPEVAMIFDGNLKVADLGSGLGDVTLDILLANHSLGTHADAYGIDGFIGYPAEVVNTLTTLKPARFRKAILGSTESIDSPFTPDPQAGFFFTQNAFHMALSLSGPIQYQVRAIRTRLFKELFDVDLFEMLAQEPDQQVAINRISLAVQTALGDPAKAARLLRLRRGDEEELNTLLAWPEGASLDRMFSQTRQMLIEAGLVIVAPRYRLQDFPFEALLMPSATLLDFFAKRNLLFPLNPPPPFRNDTLNDNASENYLRMHSKAACGVAGRLNAYFKTSIEKRGAKTFDEMTKLTFGQASSITPHLSRSLYRAVSAEKMRELTGK